MGPIVFEFDDENDKVYCKNPRTGNRIELVEDEEKLLTILISLLGDRLKENALKLKNEIDELTA